MSRTIILDPVTRIEGHLRLDVEVDKGLVTKAWSSAQMWRGIETILRGRDPQDAWTFAQRFCGVCTTVHAIASIRALEDALNLQIPLNAQLIRNLMIAQHSVQDHIVHFYHLCALDWIDLASALKANPLKAASIAQELSDWPGNSGSEFRAVQQRVSGLVNSGKLGIFGSGYWGHPEMRLAPELNLIALCHYLKAFDYQRQAAQAVAIVGGKNPHVQNLVVGGVATAVNIENLATLNLERLVLMRSLMQESREFVHKVYYPDVLAIASAYKDWFGYGSGVTNYLAVPEFPEDPAATRFALPGGFIKQAGAEKMRPITQQRDSFLRDEIRESVARAWYSDSSPAHPWSGETIAQYSAFERNGKYSWCKAPRLSGMPVQVGPLAQILVGYAGGAAPVRRLVDAANAKLGITLKDYHSTMGRVLARCLRACMMADFSLELVEKLIANLAAGDMSYAHPVEIPEGEFRGVGFHEAPRGSLSHWIVIQGKKIANYQAVVPSTWNASPRDEQGLPGPYEASLEGTPVQDAEKPLEVLRCIHSFDPCVACAVHAVDPEGRELTSVKVL